MSRTLLPLNALRAFDSAARHLNFSRAAEELAVTPGAISQQIRQLEEIVRAPLFKREARGLQLTDLGRSASGLVAEGLDRLRDASMLLREPPRRRQVAISVPPSFASKWLMPRLDDFHQAHPDIEVWVSADMTPVEFDHGAVDLAIRYGAGDYAGHVSERLLVETVLPVCSPLVMDGAHPLRSPQDLGHHVLLHDISADGDASRPDWPMWLMARGVRSRDAGRGPRYNQSALVVEAAVAGRGVALAKRTLAQADLAAGRLIAPFHDGGALLAFAYHLVHPKTRPLSPSAETFAIWLRRQAALHDSGLDEL